MLAVRRDVAHDGLQRGRAPDAVAAEHRHDLALAHLEGEPLQDVALAVIGVQVAHLEQGLRHAAAVPR